MANPAWQTDELGEEWVESTSPSPPHRPPSSPKVPGKQVRSGSARSSGSIKAGGPGGGFGSLADKRGSLRSLGYSAPRGLPSRPPSSENANTSPLRIVSGHRSGSRLFPSGDYIVPQGTGLLSPPSSRSSSEGDAPSRTEVEGRETIGGGGPGTCVVKDGVEDDRGGGLARIGAKSKDIFGKNALERMFEPPSPPSAPTSALTLASHSATADPAASTPASTTPQRPLPGSLSDLGASPTPSPAAIDEARRASHPFAPRNPSRLSKSMTPSSHSSNPPSETSQLPADDSAIVAADETLPPAEDEEEDEDEGQVHRDPGLGPYPSSGLETSLQHMSLASGEVETDLSPLARGATRFPFTFKAPIRTTSAQTGTATSETRTGSGSATVRGGSVRSHGHITAPASLDQQQDDEFEALFNEPDTGEGLSHSTVHRQEPPSQPLHQTSAYHQRPVRVAGARPPKSPKVRSKPRAHPASPHLPTNPNLRLFRSTYDTYTREHLSAIVDSIALDASPSPPPSQATHPRNTGNGRADVDAAEEGDDEGQGDTWGSATGSGGSLRSGGRSSTDSRSSKRLRLSPPSPRRQPRDWGNVGLEIMGRIKGRQVEESTTSASPYHSQSGQSGQSGVSGTSLVDEDEGPMSDYPAIPPTPSSKANPRPTAAPAPPQHRSNPSTASSGYLRTAEAMMANLRQRAVSNSESALSGDNTLESSLPERRVLSETDENAGSSETDAWRSEWEYGQSGSGRAGSKGGSQGKKTAGATGPSPRRLLRGLSAAEERRQGQGQGRRLPQSSAQPVAGPGHHPNPDLEQDQADRPINTEDLARFVSATTVPTYSTTISTSFVKHPGPRPKGGGQMRMIRPDEVNALLGEGQQVGKMRYDATAMRWVRDAPAPGSGPGHGLGRVSEGSREVGSEESVDVFAGMSEEGSRRASSSVHPPPPTPPVQEGSQGPDQAVFSDTDAETDTDTNDEEDHAADDPGRSLANMTTLDADALIDTSSSEDENEPAHGRAVAGPAPAPSAPPPLTSSPSSLAPPPLPALPSPTASRRPAVMHANSAPAIMTPLPPSHLAPKPIRSALRNGNGKGETNSRPASDRDLAGQLLGTPLPASTPGLKKKASWVADLDRDLTPFISPGRSITRSVSFSDGRKVGKIEGLETGTPSTSRRAMGAGAGAGGMSISQQLRGLGEEVRQAKERAAAAVHHSRKTSMDELRVPTPAEELSGKEGGDGNLFDRNGMSLLASARTRRIQEVLGDMEELSLDNITPSKPGRQSEPIRQSAALAPTPNPRLAPGAGQGHGTAKLIDVDNDASPVAGGDHDLQSDADVSTLPARSFRRSRSHREANGNGIGQATFLTECSFAATSDHLVKVITDVQPFEPYWEELREVDLSAKGLEGVGRLKEFLPSLDEVNLNDNAISYLTGIPSSVRTLHVSGNRLSSLTSVDHLRNLQVLDLSRNQLDSVSQLRCLKHLRELRADHNRISDLSGIMSMDSLLKLSLRSNRVERLDLRGCKWGKLDSLDLAENGLGEVEGLEELRGLVTLNLDDNDLTTLSAAPRTPLLSLRTLRVCRNDLALLDLAHFPKIRTLYADENRLVGLQRSDRTTANASGKSRLEALSMRSQRSRGLKSPKAEMAGLKRLYISGNDLPPSFIPCQMPQLAYLEMAACRLSTWPSSMATLLPNLEVLNANYNFFESLDGLRGMRGLRKVTLVGNRLQGEQEMCAGVWKGMDALEEVDLRMNPGTLGFYLSLFSPPPALSTSTAYSRPHLSRPNKTAVLLGRAGAGVGNATLSASTRTNPWTSFAGGGGDSGAQGEDWADMDRVFRRNLPDMWYSRRLAYRGRIMRQCPRLRSLDGLEVGEGERRKAGELIDRLERDERR